MILKERAIDAGTLSGAAFLVIASWWLAGQLHDHPAAAPLARPAPTVTVTSAPVPVAAPTGARTVTPAPRTSGPSPAPAVVSAADRTAAMPHTSDGGTSHAEARPPSAAQPPSSAASCSGGVLSVQALHALCVSLGR